LPPFGQSAMRICMVANSGEFDKQAIWALIRLRRLVAARRDRRARGTIVGRTQRQLPVEIHMS
jgi:hypothetical protein